MESLMTSIIELPNGSSGGSGRDLLGLVNASSSKKVVADSQHLATDNSQDVSFLVGTTAETVFLLLIFAACVVSNSLVFVIFYQKPTFRSLSNRFVLNLAMCNLLYSLLVIPNVIVSIISDGSAVGLWWCRLTKLVTILLALSSAFSVLLIAVDRYCAVMNPLHYSMTITGARSTLMIAFIWSLALGLSILPMARLQDSKTHAILIHKSVNDDTDLYSNDEDNEVENLSSSKCLCWTTVTSLIISYHRLWYSITVACLGFVLPLLLLCWIYACMYRAAKQNNDRARRHSVTTNPSEVVYQHEALTGNCSMSSGECTPINTSSGGTLIQSSGHLAGFKKTFCRRRSSNASVSVIFFREEGRAAQTGLLVIITFAFCWFPYFAFIVFEALPQWIGIPALSRILAQHLTFIGCALNPFVYVYRNRLVWKDARHVLHCSKRNNMTINSLHINNNHMNQHRCNINNTHLPIQSPLTNHRPNIQPHHQVSRLIHQEFACLHSYPISSNRLARSLRQAGPKITSDARHHRLLYEIPAEENIELNNLKNTLSTDSNVDEPMVIVSNVDECSKQSAEENDAVNNRENILLPKSSPNLAVSLPIPLHNTAPVMDFLKIENAYTQSQDVIGSSWSLPNHVALYSLNSTSDVNFEIENESNYVRINRNLCKKQTVVNNVGNINLSEIVSKKCRREIERNQVHSKSAQFTRNVNNHNNENNHHTMSEMTVNKSNIVHIYNINNNHHHHNHSSGKSASVGPRKRVATMSAGGQGSTAGSYRRPTTARHASTTTLLDITQSTDHQYQGTTI